jgi:hypothetical protein
MDTKPNSQQAITRALDGKFLLGHPPTSPGRPPNAGRSIKEYVNDFAAMELTEQELRMISKDTSMPWPKRSAAMRVLHSLESADISDFEPWLDGTPMKDIRANGIDTAMIKKVRVKISPTQNGDCVEREIELHDRGPGALRDILDYTDGKPKQSMDIDVQLPAAVVFEVNRIKGDTRPPMIDGEAQELPSP